MTTVKQLIEYLQTLEPATEVEILEEYTAHWQTSSRYIPLDIYEHANLGDFTHEKWEKHNNLYGKKILTLGSH